MRFIIQDRNSVIFNGINISDEVKSQVTSIEFITQDIRFTRNATFFEKMQRRIFGDYKDLKDFINLKPEILKKGKKYSIYIENAEKCEFCKGDLAIECDAVFINEIGEVFVEAARCKDALNEIKRIEW